VPHTFLGDPTNNFFLVEEDKKGQIISNHPKQQHRKMLRKHAEHLASTHSMPDNSVVCGCQGNAT